MSSLSWSENREKCQGISESVIKERIKNINDVLAKLSKDEDLQDDFKLPQVTVALNHWTGKARLPPEEAEALSDNRRVVYVLQRLQMLQSVCRASQVAVPFDHFIKGRSKLSDEAILHTFGPFIKSMSNINTKVTEEGQSYEIKKDKVQTGLKKDSAAVAAAAPSLAEYAKTYQNSAYSDASPPSIYEVLYAIGNKYFSIVLGSVIALLSIVAFLIANSNK
eukprot:gene28053-36938_t